MCTEALCLRANEFTFDTSWYPKAHIKPVFQSQREHFPLVLLILLWSKQFASIIITYDPKENTIKQATISCTAYNKKGLATDINSNSICIVF